jgi:glutamate synthase domain-containing protein 1
MLRKRCNFVMEDGHKCNRVFTVEHAVGKNGVSVVRCEEHRGANTSDGLTKSTNIHAQEGNNIRMREWVMKKMREETKAENRIANLEIQIERLTKLLEVDQSREDVLRSEVRKVVKQLDPLGGTDNPEIIRINERLLTIHNRSIRVDRKIEELLDDWDKMLRIGKFKEATATRISLNSRALKRVFKVLAIADELDAIYGEEE